MTIRFNNGRGAVTCEKCNIIVDQDFDKVTWDALSKMEVPCFCKDCDEEKYKRYNKELFKLIEKEMFKCE